MPVIVYVPRVFGGTLILSSVPPPPPTSLIPTLLVVARFRSGEQPAQYRSGQVKTGGR